MRDQYPALVMVFITVSTVVVVLVVSVIVCLQIELHLFKLIDHHICLGLLQHKVYTAPPMLQFLPSEQVIVRAAYLDPSPPKWLPQHLSVSG